MIRVRHNLGLLCRRLPSFTDCVATASLVLFLASSLASTAPCSAATAGESRLAFSARVDGNWDIYSIRADGTDLRRLTDDPAEDRAPAYSPDGSQLLFQSRRADNWDIYRLDLNTGELHRMTREAAYDGMPAWSPSGHRVAFESMRAGDLDIFVMNSDGSAPVNLTSDSPEGDTEPKWSPDGDRIVFTSWRLQDKDIYSMASLGGDVTQLTTSAQGEDQAAWSPDGRHIAFVYREPDIREVSVLSSLSPPSEAGLITRLTWTTANEWPAWSPDGRRLAWLEQRFSGWKLQTLSVNDVDVLPSTLVEGRALSGPLSWNDSAFPFGQPIDASVLGTSRPRQFAFRWAELDTPNPAQPEVGWSLAPDVEVSNERMNASVVPAFIALRDAIQKATGHDFLAQLSDAWRPLDAASETSSYSSWHKTGRAIDFLFDYRDAQRYPLMEVTREEIGGETYWRIYLRCTRQDGSQGTPLREHPWDFSGTARVRYPELGGRWKAIPDGYYVDVTDLADAFGWDRIAAVDKPDYSWKWHFLAIEYWHHQKDEGLDWYGAMRQVYPEGRLASLFNWRSLRTEDVPEWRIAFTGVPIPLVEQRWRLVRP